MYVIVGPDHSIFEKGGRGGGNFENKYPANGRRENPAELTSNLKSVDKIKFFEHYTEKLKKIESFRPQITPSSLSKSNGWPSTGLLNCSYNHLKSMNTEGGMYLVPRPVGSDSVYIRGKNQAGKQTLCCCLSIGLKSTQNKTIKFRSFVC